MVSVYGDRRIFDLATFETMKYSTFIVIQALQLAAFLASFVEGGSSANAYGSNFFVDSANTYYDGYQQAWRYLGWYVKCGYPSDRYDEEESGDHEENHESEDHDDRGRKLNSGDNNRWQGSNYCQRYLIWAAVRQLRFHFIFEIFFACLTFCFLSFSAVR